MPISARILFASLALAPVVGAQDKVDFMKQVYPLFKKACFECHGKKEQEADLRLDVKKGLFVADKEDWTVIPGKPDESELFVRVSLPHDDEDIMPPEGDPLKKKEVAIIRKWIEQGAVWPDNADAAIAKQIEAATPKIEKLELPALSDAQKAAEKTAFAAVKKAGGLAMRVAANTTASEVNLSLLRKKATNKHVAMTADLSGTLVRLDLKTTGIDDGALATVAKHSHLMWLNLSNTKVTDAGLDHLKGLTKLRYLNLYGTKVSDAGLKKLSGLTGLQKLFLWQTQATKAGVQELKKSLPNVAVDMGDYAKVLKSIKPPAKKTAKKAVAINKKCPVSGQNVDPSKTSVFQGQVIGLCCGKCKAKFDKNPKRFIGKVKEFKKGKGKAKKQPKKTAKAKRVANKSCPVSGRALAADVTSPYQGRVIGFCCKNCKAKFDKNPRTFLPKLKGIFEKVK